MQINNFLKIELLVFGVLLTVTFLLGFAQRVQFFLHSPTPGNVIEDTGTALEEVAPTTILLTGDTMLGRSVNYEAQDQERFYPFAEVKEEIESVDIAVTNLESPLLRNCPLTNAGMQFCGDCDWASTLSSIGFDVSIISNNHIKDWGEEGYLETVHCLEKQGIGVVGEGHTVVKLVNKVNYGFLGYNAVWESVSKDVLKRDIRKMRESADVVFVYFHWGEEYTAEPNEYQVLMAREAIENGADMVFGSHPHWIQSFDVYQDVPIFYSLGNFVFDQGWSEATLRSLAVKLVYVGGKLVDIQLLPVKINDDWSVSWGDKEVDYLEEGN